VDDTGVSAGQRAGKVYLAALERLDAAWVDAPPGLLSPEQQATFVRKVSPVVVGFTEESKQLSDRYQQALAKHGLAAAGGR
jgi:hypothetical protein